MATVRLSQSDTVAGLKEVIEGRIQALANVHSLFVQSRWIGAGIYSLMSQELSAYCKPGATGVLINGPEVLLEPALAQTIAVTAHELATNAAKYGALSIPEGTVRVEWERAADGKGLVLRWTETGGPLVNPPTRKGFGTRMMESLIHAQLGEIRFDWRAEGLTCEIAVPARPIEPKAAV